MPEYSAPQRPTRVLVVDDCADARSSLRTLLEMWGADVREAGDAALALKEARAFRPDTAILDIRLPDKDGFELASQLRQEPGLEDLCLIAITGFREVADPERASAVGFKQVLFKPYDPRELEHLIRNWQAVCERP